jgi:hypothetical protein
VFSDAQRSAGFVASYNNQVGSPTGIYSGVTGRLDAAAGLARAALVAVTEQLGLIGLASRKRMSGSLTKTK